MTDVWDYMHEMHSEDSREFLKNTFDCGYCDKCGNELTGNEGLCHDCEVSLLRSI